MLDFPGTEEFIKISASALELGVLLSVAEEDLDAFARNVAQLKSYYASLSSFSSGSTTPKKCHILGLNLMYL